MNITDIRVRKVTKEGKMKAVVSITIDDEFVVHDIKVIDAFLHCGANWPSKGGNALSKILEDLTNSCISV